MGIRGGKPDKIQKITQKIMADKTIIEGLSSEDPQKKVEAEKALTEKVAELFTEKVLLTWIIALAILGGLGLLGMFALAFKAEATSGLSQGLLAVVSGITGGLVGLIGGRAV